MERLLVEGPLVLVGWTRPLSRIPPTASELDRAVFVDLWAHAQHQAHVLRSTVVKGDRARIGGVGIAAGGKGHVVANDDLGLLVVQRHQVGGGEHVGIAALLQEVGQRAQVVLAVDARRQATFMPLPTLLALAAAALPGGAARPVRS